MREQSKLARAVAAQNGQGGQPSKFTRAALGARVLEPFVIPRLNLPAVMTLVPHHRVNAIEGEVIEEMERRLRIGLNATTELHYECERAARTLAEAVLDPDEVKREIFAPIADVSDWRNLDQDIIGDCWRIHGDVRAMHDPISMPLTEEEVEAIEIAIKKKAEDPDLSARLLRHLGIRRLSSYLLRSADRLFPSVTPTSSPTASVPD